MANYVTNIFHASTENQNDLNKIEDFLSDNFSGYTNKDSDFLDAEFSSDWEYPETQRSASGRKRYSAFLP